MEQNKKNWFNAPEFISLVQQAPYLERPLWEQLLNTCATAWVADYLGISDPNTPQGILPNMYEFIANNLNKIVTDTVKSAVAHGIYLVSDNYAKIMRPELTCNPNGGDIPKIYYDDFKNKSLYNHFKKKFIYITFSEYENETPICDDIFNYKFVPDAPIRGKNPMEFILNSLNEMIRFIKIFTDIQKKNIPLNPYTYNPAFYKCSFIVHRSGAFLKDVEYAKSEKTLLDELTFPHEENKALVADIYIKYFELEQLIKSLFHTTGHNRNHWDGAFFQFTRNDLKYNINWIMIFFKYLSGKLEYESPNKILAFNFFKIFNHLYKNSK